MTGGPELPPLLRPTAYVPRAPRSWPSRRLPRRAFLFRAALIAPLSGLRGDPFTRARWGATTLYWQASYSGDEENDPSVSVCGDEVLTVTKNQPGNSTAQTLIPDDSFTLSGATTDAGGSIDFYLFPPGEACTEANALDAAFSELDVAVSGNATYSTTNAADASPIEATTEGTWKWLVIYSGDDNNEGTTSNCVEEFTIDNDTTPPPAP